VNLEAFNERVRRPKFSAMSNEQIAGLLNMEIPTWENAVRTFLKKP
jgi:dTDP-4-dehydrorhamnose reductase